jgi:hypothetical protein
MAVAGRAPGNPKTHYRENQAVIFCSPAGEKRTIRDLGSSTAQRRATT